MSILPDGSNDKRWCDEHGHYRATCEEAGLHSSNQLNSAEDMQAVADEASLPYCPCGGQCHHSPNPCSFGCIAGAARRRIDEQILAQAIETLAHGHCCWDAAEDAPQLAAEYERIREGR